MMFRSKYFKTCSVLGSAVTEAQKRGAIIPCSHHRAPGQQALGARRSQPVWCVSVASKMLLTFATVLPWNLLRGRNPRSRKQGTETLINQKRDAPHREGQLRKCHEMGQQQPRGEA